MVKWLPTGECVEERIALPGSALCAHHASLPHVISAHASVIPTGFADRIPPATRQHAAWCCGAHAKIPFSLNVEPSSSEVRGRSSNQVCEKFADRGAAAPNALYRLLDKSKAGESR